MSVNINISNTIFRRMTSFGGSTQVRFGTTRSHTPAGIIEGLPFYGQVQGETPLARNVIYRLAIGTISESCMRKKHTPSGTVHTHRCSDGTVTNR